MKSVELAGSSRGVWHFSAPIGCRDLWLTIRSAFSARLPKGDFKLVYRDVDDDLLLHKNEPWPYFKSTATTLLLLSTS